MKKTVLLASLFAVGTALATVVDSANAIGVLKVDVSDAKKPQQVLLAVPFGGFRAENSNIRAIDLVSPANLPVGTFLRVANGNVYDSWQVNASHEWESATALAIDAQGKVNAVTTGEGTVGRGNAVWLDFSACVGDVKKPEGLVTLLGQKDAKTSVELVPGKWNLIGNPGVGNFDFTGKISNLAIGDQICVQNANGVLKTYTYNGSKWVSGRSAVTSITIQAGDGCWVCAKNATQVNF